MCHELDIDICPKDLCSICEGCVSQILFGLFHFFSPCHLIPSLNHTSPFSNLFPDYCFFSPSFLKMILCTIMYMCILLIIIICIYVFKSLQALGCKAALVYAQRRCARSLCWRHWSWLNSPDFNLQSIKCKIVYFVGCF